LADARVARLDLMALELWSEGLKHGTPFFVQLHDMWAARDASLRRYMGEMRKR